MLQDVVSRLDHPQRNYHEYAMADMNQQSVFLDTMLAMQQSFQIAINCIQEQSRCRAEHG